MSKGRLFVISGASGVGKSTVLRSVIKQREDLCFSVSATTRPPRPGEKEAVDYYFITPKKFEAMIEAGEFLEYDRHNKALYGTPRGQLEKKLAVGNVILDIEPNGAFAVQKKRPDATLIFIEPPCWNELVKRLTGRGDTSPEQVQIRLDRAKWEMEQCAKYDFVVVNDQVDSCAEKILHIIAEKADEI